MEPKPPRTSYPLWVQLGLWGLPNRAAVWVCFWLSMACAVAGVAYGFYKPRAFLGSLFFLAALMYWLTIRWVDRHGRWT
jgi:hypothetical protein